VKAERIDCRRLLCSPPVIRVQDAVFGLADRTPVEAACTDSGALHDIPAWCRINGHEVLETRSGEGEHLVLLRIARQRA
jgi:tRNA 2-thiouridine synthesizing protein A